jgi:hypothetical protein
LVKARRRWNGNKKPYENNPKNKATDYFKR